MLKLYRDCKEIPGNALKSQHRLLVSVMCLPKPIRIHVDQTETVKRKKLHSPKGAQLLEWAYTYLNVDIESDRTVNKMWSNFEKLCLEKAKTTLSVSLGALRLNKETSWWNEGVIDLKTVKRDAF